MRLFWLRFIPLLALCSLTGCIGLATVFPEKYSCSPRIGKRFSGGKYQQAVVCNYREEGDIMTISKEEVMLLPGYAKPQKVKVISTTEEVWIYDKKGFVWAGFVPLVIIPIPIIFPVGKKYEYIFFEDNIVRERKENYSGYVSGTCGALFTGAEYGCEITYNEEHLFKFTLN